MNKKKGLGFLDWLLILAFLIGIVVLLYPTISDQWNRFRNRQLVTGYSKAVEQLSDSEYEEIWAEARAYNAAHKVNVISDVFGEDYILSHPYDTLLNPNGDEIMGSIEIPKINVVLAIYHGVGAAVLEQGCGHVEGTSLPVGGPGTHTVLAAHRGLPSAELFTDLDQLEIGDMFYLHVMGETLAYEVDQIETVLPHETEYLDIEEGEDYATLLTCTPYGVNTHRLLVRGRRAEYMEEMEGPDGTEVVQAEDPIDTMRLAEAGIVVFLVLMVLIFWATGKRKKGR